MDYSTLADNAPSPDKIADTSGSLFPGESVGSSNTFSYDNFADNAPTAAENKDLPQVESDNFWTVKNVYKETMKSLDGTWARYLVGPVEGIVKGAASFSTGMFAGVAGGVTPLIASGGDINEYSPEHKRAMDEWMSMPIWQADTSVGAEVQKFVGDMFYKGEHAGDQWLEGYKAEADKAVASGQWTPEQAAFNVSAATTASRGWVYVAPYIFEIGRGIVADIYMKRLAKAEELAKAAADQKAIETWADTASDWAGRIKAGEDALAEQRRGNVEYKQEAVPNVALDVADSLSLEEFSKAYKESNPEANTGEINKAFMDYNNIMIQDAYTKSAPSGVFKESGVLSLESDKMAADRISAMNQDSFGERVFRSQGENPRYPIAPDVSVDNYSPLTMTRVEFDSYYKAMEVKSKIREVEDKLNAQQQKLTQLDALEDLTEAQQKAYTKAQKRIEDLSSQVKKIKEDLEAGYSRPSRKSEITRAYQKYLKNRIPWETRPGTESWKNLYTQAFDLRETEAAGLKAFQEETAWQLREDVLKENRMVQLIKEAMGRPEIPELAQLRPDNIAPIRSADMPINASTMGNTFRSSMMPTSIIDTILKATKVELSEQFIAEARDAMRVAENNKDMDLPKLVNRERLEPTTKEKLKTEYGDIADSSTGKEDFIRSLKAMNPELSDEMASAVWEQVKPSGKSKEIDNLHFPNQRSPISIMIEVLGGKSIRMLRDAQEWSPTLRKINDMIFRPELHMVKPGEPVPVSIISARKLAAGQFFSDLGRIYDSILINTNNHLVTGLKNLIPSSIMGFETGGWGLRSMPKKLNDMILDGLNGKIKPGTPASVIEAVKQLRTLFDSMYKYAKEVIPDLDYIENYVPRFYKWEEIRKAPEAFKNLLKKYIKDEAYVEDLINRIVINEGGIDLPVKDGKVRAQYLGNEARTIARAKNLEFDRKLHNIPYDEIKPFLEENLHHTIYKYINQTANRVEFARQIGVNGEKIDAMIVQAHKELQQAKAVNPNNPKIVFSMQMVKRIYDTFDAMQGAYMRINSPWVKQWIIRMPVAISNFALLHLSAIASLPEMAMPIYTGGFKAWTKAMPQMFGAVINDMARSIISRKIPESHLQILTASLNKAGPAIAAERIGALYHGTSSVLDGFSFTYNLMHTWAKAMNYLSVATYQNLMKDYLSRAAKGKINLADASDRQMKQLMSYYGMDHDMAVKWYKDGMKTSDPMFENFRQGAITFAEDNVLTSNPAVRPMWHSIPALTFLHQLKGFPAMMGNTILSRWYTDTVYNLNKDYGVAARNSSYMAATALTAVALGMVAVLAKDQINYGGPNPKYKNDMFTLFWRGSDTAGLFGAGSSVLDMVQYGEWKGVYATLLSPAAQVPVDMYHLVAGNATQSAKVIEQYTRPMYNTLYKAGYGTTSTSRQSMREMYKQWLIRWFGKTDPATQIKPPKM